MCKERAEATRTSEHQLQSIMSELRALKDKHEKDTKERKVEEKTLLENIKSQYRSNTKIRSQNQRSHRCRHSIKTSPGRSHQLSTANCK